MAPALVRYSMCRPSRRTSTRPTSNSTRKCLETEGCGKSSRATMSPTGRSWATSKPRMSRRRGSATALKASEVVVARAMRQSYSHIGICQAFFSPLTPRAAHTAAARFQTPASALPADSSSFAAAPAQTKAGPPRVSARSRISPTPRSTVAAGFYPRPPCVLAVEIDNRPTHSNARRFHYQFLFYQLLYSILQFVLSFPVIAHCQFENFPRSFRAKGSVASPPRSINRGHSLVLSPLFTTRNSRSTNHTGFSLTPCCSQISQPRAQNSFPLLYLQKIEGIPPARPDQFSSLSAVGCGLSSLLPLLTLLPTSLSQKQGGRGCVVIPASDQQEWQGRPRYAQELMVVENRLLVVGIGNRLTNTGAHQEAPQRRFASGSALRSGNVAVAVNQHVDGIHRCLVHGCEISVFHQDDRNRARVGLQISLDRLLRFANVNRQHDQPFVGELLRDLIHIRRFMVTIAAPGGPELQQHHLALDGFIGELLAAGGRRMEARRSLFVRRRGHQAGGKRERSRKHGRAEGQESTSHAGNVSQVRSILVKWPPGHSVTNVVAELQIGQPGVPHALFRRTTAASETQMRRGW